MAAVGLESRIRWGRDDRPSITIEDSTGVVYFRASPCGTAMAYIYRLRESFAGGTVAERSVDGRFSSASAARRLATLLIRWHNDEVHELLPLESGE